MVFRQRAELERQFMNLWSLTACERAQYAPVERAHASWAALCDTLREMRSSRPVRRFTHQPSPQPRAAPPLDPKPASILLHRSIPSSGPR